MKTQGGKKCPEARKQAHRTVGACGAIYRHLTPNSVHIFSGVDLVRFFVLIDGAPVMK